MKKLNRAQKYSNLGPQNLGSRGGPWIRYWSGWRRSIQNKLGQFADDMDMYLQGKKQMLRKLLKLSHNSHNVEVLE